MMRVRVQRSEPFGGPWMMWSETGQFLDFVSGGILDTVESNEAWFDAVEACNGWNLKREPDTDKAITDE